jgi:hypothetical protein
LVAIEARPGDLPTIVPCPVHPAPSTKRYLAYLDVIEAALDQAKRKRDACETAACLKDAAARFNVIGAALSRVAWPTGKDPGQGWRHHAYDCR